MNSKFYEFITDNYGRDVRVAEGARLEIVCMPTKVYRGFESPSLRQILSLI